MNSAPTLIRSAEYSENKMTEIRIINKPTKEQPDGTI